MSGPVRRGRPAAGRGARGPGRAAALLAALALAAGCTPEAPPPPADPKVQVSGLPGTHPDLEYDPPLTITRTLRETVWEGAGDPLAEGDLVLLDYLLEDASDGSVLVDTYATSTPQVRTLDPAELGADLADTLVGARPGARLLQVGAATGVGEDVPETVTVLDVVPLRAVGETQAPREGLPAVTLAEDGRPALAATGTPAPTELVAQALVRGTGPQVAETDVVTVQYSGFAWDTGEEFDSTWDARVPASFPLPEVPSWQTALTELPVGSQVLLVVPPSYPLGVTTEGAQLAGRTVVFVVDVLAARPATGLPVPTPSAGTTAGPTAAVTP
ncbi:FKBP-type peptidyl-prolyl cis-trans isomerase [Cellulomonas endophytica]|uniref:FKBP-type peptidyl-prolyl cis-trans isomerase n=1 Tax=Cellulomonas endophytica TaxID=2494735 RepID=UPI001F0C6968|nr:FKBP-type peptidyl-prolyl cis-trans isomerase [Cellulomonas endophytica]